MDPPPRPPLQLWIQRMHAGVPVERQRAMRARLWRREAPLWERVHGCAREGVRLRTRYALARRQPPGVLAHPPIIPEPAVLAPSEVRA